MRKFLVSLLAAVAVSGFAMANSYTLSISVTNAVVTTNTISLSGWMDKVEISAPNVTAGSATVNVATCDANGTAIDTLATVTASNSAASVVRTRVIGTTNAGVALTAASSSSSNTESTILTAQYERVMLGGNMRVVVTPTGATAGGTVTVTVFYTPAVSMLLP